MSHEPHPTIIVGTRNDDQISGTDNGDIVIAKGGDDTITTGSGNDFIEAGKGDDVVDAGDGNDFIDAGKGQDFIDGGDGQDVISAGSGNDEVYGGAGNDLIYTGSGDDTVDGGAGSDYVNAGSGNDVATYVLAENQGSSDVYDGSTGTDTLRLVLTRDEWGQADVQADIAAFVAFLDEDDSAGWGPRFRWCYGHGGYGPQDSYQFESFNLTAKNFEFFEVIVDGVAINPLDESVDARDDGFDVSEDNLVTGNVLANDDVPDLVGSVSLVSDVTRGQLVLNADGSFAYDTVGDFEHLAEGETTTETFTYEVADVDGDTNSATVTITITGTNDGPVAAIDTAAAEENGSAVAIDVLSNDTDVDSDDDASTLRVVAAVGRIRRDGDVHGSARGRD